MHACCLAVSSTETSAEPSLQAKQLQLKRARLADDLNDKISHRPGPIELVHKNILSVSCPVHSPLGNYTHTPHNIQTVADCSLSKCSKTCPHLIRMLRWTKTKLTVTFAIINTHYSHSHSTVQLKQNSSVFRKQHLLHAGTGMHTHTCTTFSSMIPEDL